MNITHSGQNSVLEYMFERSTCQQLKQWFEDYQDDTDYEGKYSGFKKFVYKLRDKGLVEKADRGVYQISESGVTHVRRRRGELDESQSLERPNDYHDMVRRFKGVFKEFFEDAIIQDLHEGGNFELSLRDLDKVEPQLLELLQDRPGDALAAMQDAYESMSLHEVEPGDPTMLLTDIPQYMVTSIIEAKQSSNVDTLVAVEGMVAEISAIYPEITAAVFECTNCGDRFEKEQDSAKLKTPYKCDCGCRNFDCVEEMYEDVLELVLQEESDEAVSKAESIRCFLRGDSVHPGLRTRFEPGQTAKVVGVPETEPVKQSDSKQDVVLDCYGIETSSISWDSIEVEDEEREQLKEYARGEVYRSIAPHLVGEDADMMRKAGLFSVVGAPDRFKHNGRVKFRGNIHSLIVSPPSEGKTDILRDIKDIFPRAKYSDCTNSTAVGLIASLEQEEDNRWRVVAKTMVKANGGVACLDEFDAMEEDSTEKLNEALENQETHLAKASIEVTLPCDTNVLAAANPVHGDFDPHEPVVTQLPDAAASTLSRFDIQVVSQGVEDETQDRDVAEAMLGASTSDDGNDRVLTTDELRKYVYLAKQVEPSLTEDAADRIASFYADIRKRSRENDDFSPAGSKPRARIVRSIQNVATCMARLDFSEYVTEEHADDAISFFETMFANKGLDLDEGEFGIDSTPSGKRRYEQHIKKELMEVVPSDDTIPKQKVFEEVEYPDDSVEEVLKDLKRDGELYEPENGKIGAI